MYYLDNYKDTFMLISAALFPVGLAAVLFSVRARRGDSYKRAAYFSGLAALVCACVAGMGASAIVFDPKCYDSERICAALVFAGQLCAGVSVLLLENKTVPDGTATPVEVGSLLMLFITHAVYCIGTEIMLQYDYYGFLIIEAAVCLAVSAVCVRIMEKHSYTFGNIRLLVLLYLFSLLMVSLATIQFGGFYDDMFALFFYGSALSAFSGALLCRELFTTGSTGNGRTTARRIIFFIGQYLIAFSLLRFDY